MVQHNAIDHSGLTGVGDVAAHEADTTAVHGIADTSTLYKAGGTDVAVADGGTGSSTAAAARTALGAAAATDVTDHTADASDAHDASAISFVPDGSIAATNVQAAIVEVRDEAASGSGIPATIVDAKGDSIVATAADTVAREAVGADGTVLTAASGEATGRKWVLPQSGKVTKTDGDFATTSTSFVDVTGMSVTITTGARRCLVIVTGDFFASSESILLGIDIDGALQGGTLGSVSTFDAASNRTNISFSILTAALTAASHTFKLQVRSAGGGTVTLDADTGRALELAVVEQFAA